jgi:hypothetical protein
MGPPAEHPLSDGTWATEPTVGGGRLMDVHVPLCCADRLHREPVVFLLGET